MRRLSSLGFAATLIGTSLLTSVAHAQSGDPAGQLGIQPYTGGLLPSVGGNVGDLRPQLERYFRTSVLPATAPAWVFESSLGVDVGVTDNALRTTAPRRADVFTVLSPTLSLTGDTSRVQTNLVYSPLVQLYATQGSQTQVSQFFNGQSLVTLVPDALFLDVRGSITQSSLLGSGFNSATTQSTSSFNRQNQVQSITYSVTPYAEHRFGGWGTARIGYSYTGTIQDAYNDQASLNNQFGQGFGQGVNQGLGYGAIGNLTTNRERASFASGENLGRFNVLSVLEAIQYDGNGSYSGAYRNQFTNQLGFALTRKITILGGLGYQDIRYAGAPPLRINEPTWNGGVRYTPNNDSTITVLYGRRDGAASVSVDAQFAVTARIRVFGRYSTGITSDIEEAQNVLQTTSVGPAGLLTDTVTGAPVGGGGSFGVQNGVYRVRRASATALFLANRDSYSATITQEDRTTLTNSSSFFTDRVVPAGVSTSSLYGTASWQHELTPDMTSTLSAQYGSTNNASQFIGANNGQQSTVGITAAISKQFTNTLSGSIRYNYINRFGSQVGVSSAYNFGNYDENSLLVGLRKSF